MSSSPDLRFRRQSGSTRLVILRSLILLSACGYFLGKILHPVLLPYGSPVFVEPPARNPSVPWYTTRASLRNRYPQAGLQFHQGRTYQIRAPPLLQGPETILVSNDDRVFGFTTETAQLLELTDLPTPAQEQEFLRNAAATRKNHHNNPYVWNATSVVVPKDLGMGRPLGGRFHGNTLYIADAVLGVTQIQHLDRPDSMMELLTNQVTVYQKLHKRDTFYTPVPSPLLFVNSLAVGPVTNKIYFTDSTDIPPDRIGTKDRFVWDIVYASQMDLVRGKAMGRLCEYNPATGVTRVLADQIRFANGIAVDPVKEEYLIVAETAGINVLKYHLTDSVKQSIDLLTPEEYLQPEVLVTSLPGYVDNVDCAMVPDATTSSTTTTTKCFVAIVAEVAAVHRIWRALPSILSNFVRTILMLVPRTWLPAVPSRYSGVLVVDPVSGEHDYSIQDYSGTDMAWLTGATVSSHAKKLYLGSLHNDYVGVYLLSSSSSMDATTTASQEDDQKSKPSESSSTGKEEL